jgi:hypothetical protein
LIRGRFFAVAIQVLVVAASGCGKGGGAAPGGSASARVQPAARPPAEVSGPVPVGVPIPVEKVAEVVNPKAEAPYAGKVGTVTGHVTYAGDPPPDGDMPIPAKCAEAAATYGKLFRVGQDHALADALVTVTNYDGYVPAPGTSVTVTSQGCALAQRTIAITFGQRLEIANLDRSEPIMPYLDGAPVRAMMVALPHGAPVKLYAQKPGHYLVRDELPKPFLTADVFVLKFATHAVTGLDGRFKIDRVPVGKVRVDAFLPALGKSVAKDLDVHEGDNDVDFELAYDKANDKLPPRPIDLAHPPRPSVSASASPSASPKH